MFKFRIQKYVGLLSITIAAAAGCKAPALTTATENRLVPASYGSTQDTTNTSALPWAQFLYRSEPGNADGYCVKAMHRNRNWN
jgi:outer membrane protein, multidrug efflux system